MSIFSGTVFTGTFFIGVGEIRNYDPRSLIYWASLIGIVIMAILAGFGAKLFEEDVKQLKERWTGKNGKNGQLRDSKHL